MAMPSMILFGVTALMALIALIAIMSLIRSGYAFRLSELRKAFTSIGKWHFLLPILVVGFGCGMFLLNYSGTEASSSAVVTLNFAEASNGQDFDGTRYNMSEIISEEVLERAIKSGGFENVTVEQLSDCLSVTPVAQGDSYNEERYLIATEFLIRFDSDEYTRHLDAQNVPRMIAQAYKSLYIERFESTMDILRLDENVDFDQMEYLDVVMYLDKECSKLEYYMISMDDENSSFRDSNGNTFSGLALKIELLEDVQIGENLYAYIVQNSVARDAAAYIGRLEYANTLLDYDRQRAAASYRICNEAIERYDESMSRAVLVPTWDSDGEFYMGRTKIGTDALSLKAYEYSTRVAALDEQLEKNTVELEAMSKGSDRKAQNVDAMIQQIYATMCQYADDALALTQEYLQTQMNQCISVTVVSSSLRSVVMRSAIMAAMFYCVLILALVSAKTRKLSFTGRLADLPDDIKER